MNTLAVVFIFILSVLTLNCEYEYSFVYFLVFFICASIVISFYGAIKFYLLTYLY